MSALLQKITDTAGGEAPTFVVMNPADFAAMRANLLLRMGEGEAARGLVQDIDSGNYTPGLTQAAMDAYVFEAGAAAA
jgi:hypothetical protein